MSTPRAPNLIFAAFVLSLLGNIAPQAEGQSTDTQQPANGARRSQLTRPDGFACRSMLEKTERVGKRAISVVMAPWSSKETHWSLAEENQ